MKRTERHWIYLAASFALAISVPVWLLSESDEAVRPEAMPTIAKEVPAIKQAKLETLIAKPLFSQGRSAPSASEESGAAAPNAPIEAAPQLAPLPSLVGVASGRRRSVAIVRGQDGQAVNLKPGEEVDGWRLVRVSKTAAIFANRGKRQSVNLNYGGSGTGGPGDGPETEAKEPIGEEGSSDEK